jgi:amidohydrolase
VSVGTAVPARWAGKHRYLAAAFAELTAHLPAAVDLRHRVHADPRLSGDERDTAVLVAGAMEAEDPRWISDGLVARFGSARGPAIAIRAELDALPLVEESSVPWRATGKAAHVCGHDVHLGALAAVTRSLARLGCPVSLVAVLQPREETLPCGAADFVASEDLRRHDIRAFFGVHLQPRLPEGKFSAVAGPVNASADEFEIVLAGSPAHGAYPQLARDPVVAMAALISSLQHLVSRRSDPMSPCVVTVGSAHAGSSFNAIPGNATIRGTLRTFDEAFRAELHALVRQTASGIAVAHGCEAVVEIGTGEPIMINDPHLSTIVTAALEQHGFAEGTALRSCGADDFAFYSEIFPSLMIFLGTGSGADEAPGLHHPRFLPPDRAVEQVARAMLVAYAEACEAVIGAATGSGTGPEEAG